MSDTWKHDLAERLKNDLSVCSGEHVAHADEQGDNVRYSMTCEGEVEFSILLGKGQSPERWYERWSHQHQHEVARGFLKRLLVTEAEPPPIKPGGLLEDLLIIGQTTNDTLKRIQSIMEMQADRIAVLETAVEALDKRTVGSISIGNALGGNTP